MSSAEISTLLQHDMNFFIPEMLMPSASLQQMIEAMRNTGPVRIADIAAGVTASEQPRLWRCLGWMLKHGICVREHP